MKSQLTREDDFETRRKHLSSMSDEELKTHFWNLATEAVTPLIELAKTHTSPSIERSVLLRMGFSSLEAKALVDMTIAHQLMGKGAGHVVYKLSQHRMISIREAGLILLSGEGWEEVSGLFGGHHG